MIQPVCVLLDTAVLDNPDPSFLKRHKNALGNMFGGGLMHSDEEININFISGHPLATVPPHFSKKERILLVFYISPL